MTITGSIPLLVNYQLKLVQKSEWLIWHCHCICGGLRANQIRPLTSNGQPSTTDVHFQTSIMTNLPPLMYISRHLPNVGVSSVSLLQLLGFSPLISLMVTVQLKVSNNITPWPHCIFYCIDVNSLLKYSWKNQPHRQCNGQHAHLYCGRSWVLRPVGSNHRL